MRCPSRPASSVRARSIARPVRACGSHPRCGLNFTELAFAVLHFEESDMNRVVTTIAILWATLACWAWSPSTSGPQVLGGEIGFIEDFSLATDRGVPLKQLIPGTEDYYYY